MGEERLIVSGEDGTKFIIYVLDLLEKGEVKEFPNKEYIAYSFDEPNGNGQLEVYYSILEEKEKNFSLLGISNKDEFDIIKKYMLS